MARLVRSSLIALLGMGVVVASSTLLAQNKPPTLQQLPQDPIDLRVPRNPDRDKLLRKATAFVAEMKWSQAIPLLQSLLNDNQDDSLSQVSDGRWVAARAEANRIIGSLPSAALKLYTNQYEEVANQKLAAAQRTKDFAGFAVVANQYFHTSAGQQAVNELATRHLDRGEFGRAARKFYQLWAASSVICQDRRWQLKAALTFRAAGQPEAAEKLAKQLLADDGFPNGNGDLTAAELRAWFGKKSEATQQQQPLDDWQLLYGNSSRNGRQRGGEPLLLRRWFARVTGSLRIHNQIEEVTQSLHALGRATIPASVPLAIDGKIAFRTLDGVQVMDLETGRLLWKTPEPMSAETLLMSTNAPNRIIRFPLPMNIRSKLAPLDSNPLTGILYKNNHYGIVSSDGQQLFVIENQAILIRNQFSFFGSYSQTDPHRRDLSSNRLASYDLATGRPIWKIGGSRRNEPFDPQLAGTYFLGAPVPAGDELFVVGEYKNDIRVFSLDPLTGHPLWSQLIAISDTRIQQERRRRWWTSQVAIGNGLIVCPTTVGWLVAVDRSDHSIAWAHRYAKRKSTESSADRNRRLFMRRYANPEPLNNRWCASAPIIVGNRVVYSPSESTNELDPTADQISTLVCLELQTGQRIWERPRGADLYVAGVLKNGILLVGTKLISAVSITDGSLLWETAITKADGRPSGRGVIVDKNFHLPLSSGQLWSLNLATGKIVSRRRLSAGEAPLGNLLMHRGMVVSLNASQVAGFEQREALSRRIQERRKSAQDDPWALERQASIHLLQEEYEQSLALLRKIDPAKLTGPELRNRYQSAMLTALVAVLRSDYSQFDREFEELRELATSNDEKLLMQRIEVERAIARKKYDRAFELCLALSTSDLTRTVDRIEDHNVRVRQDVWLGGVMSDLWSRIPKSNQEQLAGQIQSASKVAEKSDQATRDRFVEIFGFHAASTRLRRREPERAQVVDAKMPEPIPSRKMKVEYKVDLLSRDSELEVIGGGDLLVKPFRFQFDSKSQRLTILNSSDNTVYWTIPLRRRNTNATRVPVIAHTAGTEFVVRHNNVLQCISLASRKIIWTHVVPSGGETDVKVGTPTHVNLAPMQPISTVASLNVAITHKQLPNGLAFANSRFVGYVGKRQLTVLDAANGSVRWSHRGFDSTQPLLANEHFICTQSQSDGDQTESIVWRARDGKRLTFKQVQEKSARIIHLDGRKLLVTWNSETELKIAQVDANLSHTWGVGIDLTRYGLASFPRNGLVAFMKSDLSFRLIDLDPKSDDMPATDRLGIERLPEKSDVHILLDDETLFVVIGRKHEDAHSQAIPFVRVDGTITAFNRTSGRKLWSRKIDDRFLLLSHLSRIPALLFMSRKEIDQDKLKYRQLNLLALDKQTGRELLDYSGPDVIGSRYTNMRVDYARRAIELRSNNHWLRLVVTGDGQKDE